MTDERDLNAVDGGARPPDHLVERLVRLAGEGPPVPVDGAEQIKAAIRPAWQREVVNRRRRRRMLWAAPLAAAALILLAVSVTLHRGHRVPIMSGPVATLVKTVGSIEMHTPDGSVKELTDSDHHTIVAGSWVRTDASSRASLELVGGTSLRLDVGTRVRLASAGSLDLTRGAVYVDTGANATPLTVHTDLGDARDIGTQFEVRREGSSLTVRVREGAVSLTGEDDELEIRHGTQVTITTGGARETERLPAYDAAWQWVQQVAPPFELEGSSVVAFLDWVSSETGLWITFTDTHVERLATSTRLHGTLRGLAPGEAAQVILPGCGLRAERRNGSLMISEEEL